MDDEISNISEKDTVLSMSRPDWDPVYEEIIFRDSKLKCAIIAEGWPSWLSGVLSLNITPSMIYSGMERKSKSFYSNAMKSLWKHNSRCGEFA